MREKSMGLVGKNKAARRLLEQLPGFWQNIQSSRRSTAWNERSRTHSRFLREHRGAAKQQGVLAEALQELEEITGEQG